jgi:hypothetical protein
MLLAMASDIRILSVKQDDEDGVIVTFSDGTIGAYVVEELLELRPHREQVGKVAPPITSSTTNTES